jgi:hypothetical protein
MKIIISEKQQKLLTESKKLESVQNLIDQAFEQLKENCEKNWVEQYACDQMETVEEVKVVASEKGATMRGGQEMKLWFIELDIYYSSLGYTPFEDFIYQLQWEVRQIVGARNVIITIRGTINSNKDPNWG